MHTVTFREQSTTDYEASYRQDETGTWFLEHVTPGEVLDSGVETLEPVLGEGVPAELVEETRSRLEDGFVYNPSTRTWEVPS